MIFQQLKKENMIPSWVHLYLECSKFGMKHSRIISEIKENMTGIYPTEFIEVVIEKLDNLKNNPLL